MDAVAGLERLQAENEQLRGMQGHQAILESEPYKLLLAGMESQADLMDKLKQENRVQAKEVERLRAILISDHRTITEQAKEIERLKAELAQLRQGDVKEVCDLREEVERLRDTADAALRQAERLLGLEALKGEEA